MDNRKLILQIFFDLIGRVVLVNRSQGRLSYRVPGRPKRKSWLTAGVLATAAFLSPSAAQFPSVSTLTSVVDGASFRAGISAGSWITIFGTELAPASRIWRDDEIVDGVLPTTLDGVGVLVNGKPAATFFISPGQLNVQAPDDTALGPVTVEIQQSGTTIATGIAELRPASPGLFVFDPQGQKYLAAVHPDGTLVGPDGLFDDVVLTRPVAPGGIVILFGTGFGLTEPFVPFGRLFSGAVSLKEAVRVLVGGIQADVLFAGLSSAGLNQLNVRVPENVPPGDAAVIAETQGYATQGGVFLRIEMPGTAPAPGVSFAADPATIQPGQSATLQWATSNATTVSIDHGIGVVGATGVKLVSPAVTTIYTLTATGPGGTTSKTATVTVTAVPAPGVSFAADPATIQPGQSATLQWATSNATTVSIDHGIGVVGATGVKLVSPAVTTIYTLTAVGSGGTTSKTATVTVTAVSAPTLTFTASPQTIQAGQSSTLQWTSDNATTVQINQGIGTVTLDGSRVVLPSQTTTYTITAQGSGGVASATATVIVTQGTFGPCGSKTTCGQMVSCAEALFYLNVCKVNRLDGDSDGVPCESICPGG